jgi:hypothetical protein
MACDKDYKKEEYKKKVSEYMKDEISKQKVLIEDTKPWVKSIKEFLKYYNLKLKNVQRSKKYIYVHITGKQEDMDNMLNMFNISSEKEKNVLQIDPLDDLEFKKILDTKGYKELKERFTIKNEDIAVDVSTNLMWSRKTLGKMAWQEAVDYCKNLKLGGYSDWRLPSFKELKTLVKKGSLPTINIKVFPDTEPATESSPSRWIFYWTSSSENNYVNLVKCINFYYGEFDNFSNKSEEGYVRAVRG